MEGVRHEMEGPADENHSPAFEGETAGGGLEGAGKSLGRGDLGV